MQIKTLAVLLFALSIFPATGSAWVYESDDSSTDTNYTDPENAFVDYDTHNAYVEARNEDEEEFHPHHARHEVYGYTPYRSRLKKMITTNERVIIINPHEHVWGAYAENGKLLRAGLATAGYKWCDDIGRPCRTKTGSFSIYSLGDSDCISHIYPVDEGGAPMPYCMFFNGGQGIHGSNHLAEANLSHGCVRVSVDDAEWIRYNFARVGTKVIVEPY